LAGNSNELARIDKNKPQQRLSSLVGAAYLLRLSRHIAFREELGK
jgi:hypothetical protein